MNEFNLADPENMLSYINRLPDALETAWQLGMSLPLKTIPQPKMIVICGMGGSAIGGDFFGSYLREVSQVPVYSHRDYGLPSWARGEETLVICSSHSGNTEETIDCFKTAIQRECTLLSISTGGKLRDMALEAGKDAWTFEHDGQPRTALAYSFGILLGLASRLGLVENQEQDITEAAQLMREWRELYSTISNDQPNPCEELAIRMLDKNPVIFGAGNMEVIARRWKAQIAELAKAWASFEAIPEMNHNTLAGLLFPEKLINETLAVFLSAPSDHPRNQLRIKASEELFANAGIEVFEILAKGESRLAQMWSLIQFGDYVAYYLALAYGVDPTPVAILTQLKQKLAGA